MSKKSVSAFILGLLTYFVISIVLELLNINSYHTRTLIVIVILLIALIVDRFVKKKKS